MNPQTTPKGVQGSALSLSRRFRSALKRALRRSSEPSETSNVLELLEEELAYTELVEALEETLCAHCKAVLHGAQRTIQTRCTMACKNQLAVLAKIASIQSPAQEGQQDTGA